MTDDQKWCVKSAEMFGAYGMSGTAAILWEAAKRPETAARMRDRATAIVGCFNINEQAAG